MELAIVQSWNGDDPTHPELEVAADNVVHFLRNKGIKGSAKHLGSGKYPITDAWKRWGGTDGTPKTDLIIGRKRISLKKEGGSQLMSGKKGESNATFMAAIESLNMEGQPIVTEIEKYLNKFIDIKNPQNLTQQKKAGKLASGVPTASLVHKQFNKYLVKYFESDKGFKDAVVHEAMSGKYKFGNSKEGRANRILVFGRKMGLDSQWHDIDDSSFIGEKSSGTKVNVSFKSTSSWSKKDAPKEYNIFSVVRLTNDEIQREFEQYDGQMLTEGILSKVKDKVRAFFIKLWHNVKNWLAKSIENILIFLGLKPAVVMSEVKF